MEYLLTFLEGFISFISPCLLPMLPVYISYFMAEESGKGRTLVNALGFVLGFTLVFIALGGLFGEMGGLIVAHRGALNILTGAVVILFGVSYLGVIQIPFFKGIKSGTKKQGKLNFPKSFMFGLTFSVGLTPCIGAFLGSALAKAAQNATVGHGMLLLLFYSLGMGIPFIVSALLIDRLKSAFTFIKKHYRPINMACGILLIVIGILMMTGLYGRLLAALAQY